jgi:hypothetical protein
VEGQQAPQPDRRAQVDRVLAVALAGAALLFVAHRALAPMGETDLFFHLKIGDLIRAEHRIPFRNLFSFTYPDAPDPDLAWAFQVLVSALYALGGFPAIVLAKAALIVAAAALAHRAARRAGAGPLAAASAIAIALCGADQRLVERPHLVTFVGLGVLANLLVETRRRAALLWWVPALALVWANFHAGVFLCVLVTLLHALGAALGGRPIAPLRRVAAVLSLTVLATVCTPAGLRLPSYLLWHTGLGATRIIEEFRVANAWSDPWFFVMIALCLAGAIRLGRASLAWVLPSLLVGLLAWRSVRFVAEWAFLSTPLLALTLQQLAALEPAQRPRRVLAALTVLGLLGGSVLERRERGWSLGLAEDVVPFAAIRFVSDNGLRERLYHDLDVGCYLLWEGWPRWRVFQDARLPAYPDEFHRALDQTPLVPADFDRLLARYDVDAALINDPDINMRAGSFDPEEWALVYREADALVFARRTEGHRALIAAREIPLRMRFRFVGGSHSEPIWRPPARSPVPADEWARRLAIELWAQYRQASRR